METEHILEVLSNLEIPADGEFISLVSVDEDKGTYFGKNREGHLFFVVPSKARSEHSGPSTSKLILKLGRNCHFNKDGVLFEAVSNILECTSNVDSERQSFVRLCLAFSSGDCSTKSLMEFFSSMIALFRDSARASESEINGLFSELYAIYHLKNLGYDVSSYWQKDDRRKFDFYMSSNKRMEVKSTMSSERRHHFRHEQLLFEEYEILVISILLRKVDCGISMMDMVRFGREIYKDDYKRLTLIDKRVSCYSDEELEQIVYDEPYLENNIRFIPAEEIPRFSDGRPVGVTNAEYDSNLTMCPPLTMESLSIWMGTLYLDS